jgi:hypothetical protein
MCSLSLYVYGGLILWPVSEIYHAVHRNCPLLVGKACLSVCLHCICLPAPRLSSYSHSSLCHSTLFNFMSSTVRHNFSVGSHSYLFFEYVNHETTLEMNCTSTVFVPYFQSLLWSPVTYICISSCHHGSHMFPIFAWIHSHIVCGPISFNFYAKLLMFLCYTLFENDFLWR